MSTPTMSADEMTRLQKLHLLHSAFLTRLVNTLWAKYEVDKPESWAVTHTEKFLVSLDSDATADLNSVINANPAIKQSLTFIDLITREQSLPPSVEPALLLTEPMKWVEGDRVRIQRRELERLRSLDAELDVQLASADSRLSSLESHLLSDRELIEAAIKFYHDAIDEVDTIQLSKDQAVLSS